MLVCPSFLFLSVSREDCASCLPEILDIFAYFLILVSLVTFYWLLGAEKSESVHTGPINQE